MVAFLTLRSSRWLRCCATVLLALYAAFSSGTAFGTLDLLNVQLPPLACGTKPDSAMACCVCKSMHTGRDSCCCSRKPRRAGNDFAFTRAARCTNPDGGAPGEMTRISAHEAPSSPHSASMPATPFGAPALCLPISCTPSPIDKVPIAA